MFKATFMARELQTKGKSDNKFMVIKTYAQHMFNL